MIFHYCQLSNHMLAIAVIEEQVHSEAMELEARIHDSLI